MNDVAVIQTRHERFVQALDEAIAEMVAEDGVTEAEARLNLFDLVYDPPAPRALSPEQKAFEAYAPTANLPSGPLDLTSNGRGGYRDALTNDAWHVWHSGRRPLLLEKIALQWQYDMLKGIVSPESPGT